MADRVPHKFPSTRWTTVRRAGEKGSGSEALRQLLVRYLGPLRTHLVAEKRLSAEQAEDLLHGFIADKVLERQILAAATPQKGRFRTFLLTALGRYVSDQLRSDRRRIRLGGQVGSAESQSVADSNPGPSGAFDLSWARQVLANAASLMQQECEAGRRIDIWGVFVGRILSPTLEGAEPVSYDLLTQQFGLASVDAAANLLTTAKRMFARSLRGVVGEYMEEDEIEGEIADLRAILARDADRSR
jgi:RNA polymerase sigma-70 factor (ECF subfamily)